MTFYGESIGLYAGDVRVLAGSLSATVVANSVDLFGDGTTVTLTTGDSVILTCWGHSSLTGSDTVGGLKWALRASGIGTISVADGHDYSFASVEPSNPLPPVVVSSDTLTEVLFNATASLRDATILTGSDDIGLKVTVTSGTIVLDKIRLQIEPLGGMPVGQWSDWQVAAPGQSYPSALDIRENYNQFGTAVTVLSSTSLSASQVQKDQTYQPAWAKNAVQYSISDATLAAWPLNVSQPLISSLTFGADYLQIPGHTKSDNFQFIEYDPGGVNVATAWVLPPITLYGATSVDMGDAGASPGTAAWRLGMISGGFAYGLGDTVTTWPGDSSATLATGDKTTTQPSVVASPTLSPAERVFTYSAELLEWPMAAGVSVQDDVSFNAGSPYLAYQPPRFRYWIPGSSNPPFLRQVQRNDGLGRSAGRGRGGSSRQSSGRGRGYL